MDKDVRWTPDDAATLSRLRADKGLDHFQLARLMNLSTHQIGELESTEPVASQSHFYSAAIKATMGHRLLAKLQS
jgi:hypothetical protein